MDTPEKIVDELCKAQNVLSDDETIWADEQYDEAREKIAKAAARIQALIDTAREDGRRDGLESAAKMADVLKAEWADEDEQGEVSAASVAFESLARKIRAS